MLDDQQLLRRYVSEGSEAAFGQLVARYLNLVYSAALRRTGGDPALAQDATQLAFTDLARKARHLPPDVVLAGWLHRATRFAATQLLRAEHRRHVREHAFAAMQALQSDPAPDWDQTRPLLDAALDRLKAAERDALLLRFFEQRSLEEVGRTLGCNEDTARKRVSRALDKLRAELLRRGVATSGAALASSLVAHAVQLAPPGLAATVASASLAGAAAGSGSFLSLLQFMTLTHAKFALVCTSLVAGFSLLLVTQHRTQAELRQHNAALRQQLGELTAEQERLAAQLAQTRQSSPPTSERELLKLRGEVGVLRAQKADWEKQRAAGAARLQTPVPSLAASEPARFPKESWAFAGYATPLAALQTGMWALREGDGQTLLASLTDAARQKLTAKAEAGTESGLFSDIAHSLFNVTNVTEFSIDKQEVRSEGEVYFRLKTPEQVDRQVDSSGRVAIAMKVTKFEITAKRAGQEWRLEPEL